MTDTIRFSERVVVVTGSGAGLGRAYVLEFAKRGAKVVVNDIDQAAANSVVSEINALTGYSSAAVTDYNSVTDGNKIISNAISVFGRIDVLVNNAGILRDISFAKMNEADWDRLYDVHLKGTFSCTHAAWKYMMAQKYGRIITIASIAGICGNFGQANYAAMKSSMIGFTKSLAKEGAKYGIKVNCLVPLAESRMTAKLLPEEAKTIMSPENVSPVVALLGHDCCRDSGEIIEVAGGWISKIRFQRAYGAYIRPPFSAEKLLENWSQVGDFSEPDYPSDISDTIIVSMRKARL